MRPLAHVPCPRQVRYQAALRPDKRNARLSIITRALLASLDRIVQRKMILKRDLIPMQDDTENGGPVLEVGAADRRRPLGPERQRASATVVEGVHLLLDDVGG